jgi:dTMP kinase
MNSGKIIVVDGGDGAGKATQVSLLVERLQKEGHEVETIDFPQYTQNTFGKLLRECLDGKRGDFMSVDARIASTLYAADRFETKPKLEAWLAAGKVVVLDRYVSANMMHQGAKIADATELNAFLDWLDHMEHGVFGIPRPDLIIYLEVPNNMRMELKASAVAENKHGTGVKVDVAEADEYHQKTTEERARDIVAKKNEWHAIQCVDSDGMRSREDIHTEVYNLVTHCLK